MCRPGFAKAGPGLYEAIGPLWGEFSELALAGQGTLT